MSVEERDLGVCADCLYVEANGLDENISYEWLGFLPEYRAVGGVSPDRGWLWSVVDHREHPTSDDYEACEGYFSSQPCDACGTTLAGHRFCVKAVRV